MMSALDFMILISPRSLMHKIQTKRAIISLARPFPIQDPGSCHPDYAIVDLLGNSGRTATSWQFSHSAPGAPSLELQLSTHALTRSIGAFPLSTDEEMCAGTDTEGVGGRSVWLHLSTMSHAGGMLASQVSSVSFE